MKKSIVCAAACCLLALAATFSSCDPNKAQCWKLTVKYQDNKTIEYYFYGTGVEADAQLDVYQKTGATTVRREQTFLSKDNCHE